jgi:TonB family protein
VNEAVDKVIEQREALDRGFPAGMVLSSVAHLLLLGLVIGSAWLNAKPRMETVVMGKMIALPRGGGGPLVEAPAPVAPAPPAAEPAPEAPPKVEPPPKVIKPPKEAPKKGLPPPDAKKSRVKPTPAPRTAPSAPPDARGSASSSGVRGATAASSATPGLGIIGPAGPGSPTGTDAFGDWYLAGVQRKIWMIWNRQVRTGFTQQITVSLTILADGSIEPGSVQVLQSSGAQLLDNAAQRAVMSATPFSALPKNYGTNRITIQAVFQPTP